ncbi:MAG TPA: SDR family NAD(P)-dependent oxidoreductase [Streptosporangiaceae bacterium]|jgi:NAD(P)-dependent dehydrogenase (short-subunit alcohol dehydrogenase family)
MSQTIAIFGAGPALGASVARRFGREGFRVALVSRNRAKLDGYVSELARDGIEAAAFTADLADRTRAVEVVGEIERALGPIDVLEYSPGPLDARVVPVRDLEPDDLEPMFDLRLRTPIAVTRAVLPHLLESAAGGALLYAFGTQPRHPDPSLDNVGVAQAALLHHVHNLHASLAGDDIYAGALLIDGLIDGSEIQHLLRTGGANHLPDGLDEIEYPTVSPDRLADRYWDMYVKRDRVEELVIA